MIFKPTTEEIKAIAIGDDIDLKYRWLLNEYCYGRTENTEVLFESLRYNIVELIKNDSSLQDSFKINLIEYLNEIDKFPKIEH